MSDPIWLVYLGAASGVVGMATGISGAVMGYVAYRRSIKFKTQDLRLQLRKDTNELRGVVERLPEHLEYAKKSRDRVMNATGGNMQRWRKEWEVDRARVTELAVPDAGSDYSDLSETELETRLVQIHALTLEATRLNSKYTAAIEMDDRMRAELRANAAQRGQARGQVPPTG